MKKLDYVQNSIKKLRGSLDSGKKRSYGLDDPSFGIEADHIRISPKKNGQILLEVGQSRDRSYSRERSPRDIKDKEEFFVIRIDSCREKLTDFKKFRGTEADKMRLLKEENNKLKTKIEEYVKKQRD